MMKKITLIVLAIMPYLAIAQSSVLENNVQSISFKDNTGVEDDTQIKRFSGNALRISYNKSALFFDAISNNSIKINNSAGVTKVTLHPNGDSYFLNGNFGIGTTSLGSGRFNVQQLSNTLTSGIRLIGSNSGMPSSYFWMDDNDVLHIDNGTSSGRNVIVNTSGSGKVGIGTNTPDSKLTVDGNVSTTGDLILDNNHTIKFKSTSNEPRPILFLDNQDQVNINSPYESGTTIFTQAGTERMRIMNNGNVGIGTDAPDSKLTVEGNISTAGDLILDNTHTIKFKSTSNEPRPILFLDNQDQVNINSPYESGTTIFTQAGTERMRIMNNGNVGIGTINPQSQVHLGGSYSTLEFGDDANNDNNFRIVNEETPERGLRIYNRGNGHIMSITADKKIGIQTREPKEVFQIGDRWAFHNGGNKIIGYNVNFDNGAKYITDDEASLIRFIDNGDLRFETAELGTSGQDMSLRYVMTLKNDGNVGIGTGSPDEKLAVNGTIHAKEVKVDLNNWPDYVFTPEYNLPTLEEVKQHIDEKGHLPNVPSATEVEENGIKLGEMNALLLEKIEELTLYLIEVKKENKQLMNRIEKLEAK